jgi:hypothetical protein
MWDIEVPRRPDPGKHLRPDAHKGRTQSVPGHVPPRLVTDVER